MSRKFHLSIAEAGQPAKVIEFDETEMGRIKELLQEEDSALDEALAALKVDPPVGLHVSFVIDVPAWDMEDDDACEKALEEVEAHVKRALPAARGISVDY